MANGDGNHASGRIMLVGLGGALVVVLVTVMILALRGRSEPDTLYPEPDHIRFTGAPLEAEPPDPVAVRLRNLVAACAMGDHAEAAKLIDPESHLAGHVSAACGPIVTALAPEGDTRYQIDRVAAQEDTATVYITARHSQQEGERYMYFMRKVKGKWYFSTP